MRARIGDLSLTNLQIPQRQTLWDAVLQPMRHLIKSSHHFFFSIHTETQRESKLISSKTGAHTWGCLWVVPRVCSWPLRDTQERGERGILERDSIIWTVFLFLNSSARRVLWWFMDWKIGFHIRGKPHPLLNTAVLEGGEETCSKQELFN